MADTNALLLLSIVHCVFHLNSVCGRREKGKGKGEFECARARGAREGERKGTSSFPFSLAGPARSRAPKSPLPLLTPSTQAIV